MHRFPLVAMIAFGFLSGCATKPQKEFVYLDTTPVKISELHFEPSVEQGQVEYIEVANVSKARVDLAGWQVTGAGRVGLPPGTVLGPGQAVVLCEDLAAFREVFGSTKAVAGILTGSLKNGGETVRIETPEGDVADEAAYDDKDPEVQKAAGTGLSIHRTDLAADSTQETWTAGEPTPGAVP